MVKQPNLTLRVHGLVKAMNIARQNLEEYSRRGFSESELEAFDKWVQSIIDQTEKICGQYEIKPDQLPTPSYRAYVFLKSMNILALKPVEKADDHLEAPVGPEQRLEPSIGENPFEGFQESSPAPKRMVRVSNLITICGQFQTRLAEAASKANKKGKARREAVNSLLSEFQETVRQVEQICLDEDGSPSDLPAPSRRAYQWVKFLSDRENLELHLNALRIALRAASLKIEQRSACRGKIPAPLRNLPINFEFFNLPAIYRIKHGRASIQIIASEGFISAPPEVIEALVCMALLRDRGDYRTRVKNYADSEEFFEVFLAMEMTVEESKEAARGRIYDLDAIFQRINADYFQGKLDRPRLTWNKMLTHRKFGHYQPATDTLMISITLDQPEIPIFLVEFIMYHELLHKEMGLKIKNGRRYAHYKDFLEAEAKFEHYREAKEWLSRLGDRETGHKHL
jgi:hypothetical protein